MIRNMIKLRFNTLTEEQTNFFSAYIVGNFYALGSRTPQWAEDMLQKQQQLIQLLSNVSKVLQDETVATIRKIGS